MKTTNIGHPIAVVDKCADIDAAWGPYNSLEEAYEALGEDGFDLITIGRTVGIVTDNGIEEYWFKKACDSINDLVKKNNDFDWIECSLSEYKAMPVHNPNVLYLITNFDEDDEAENPNDEAENPNDDIERA